MTDKARFHQMLKDLNLSYKDIAEITGLKYETIKQSLQPKRELPRWCKLALYAYENK